MKTTLIIMAAGRSSRYGSLKQIETIGPSDVTLMEYSIFDAVNAGFTDVIIIIRKETISYFQIIKNRIGDSISIQFVYQDLEQSTKNKKLDYFREKPWGTAHALLCCKNICKTGFVVINADDFYGKMSFEDAMQFFKTEDKSYFIIPFLFQNTLSENGMVNRGICKVENNLLANIEEKKALTKENIELENSVVSMNFWGFQPSIFTYIEYLFETFLEDHNPSDEFYLADVVAYIIKNNIEKFKVIQSKEQWYGFTYKEDKEHTHNALCKLKYPKNLWN